MAVKENWTSIIDDNLPILFLSRICHLLIMSAQHIFKCNPDLFYLECKNYKH